MTTLILGIGNEWASDDGVGPEVVRRLQGRIQRDDRDSNREVGFSILAQPDLSLLDRIAGYSDLIIVDAVVADVSSGGSPPGTIHRQRWQPGALAERGVERASSHGLGVRELLEMGAVLGKLPGRVELVGIEITSTEPGRGLSVEVERAIEGVVGALVGILRKEDRP